MKRIVLDINEINPFIRLAGYEANGWSYNRRIYDYELLYFTTGKGLLEIDNKKYKLKKGSMVIIPPNKESKLYIEKKDRNVVWIHFDFFYFSEDMDINYYDSLLEKKELIRPALYLRNGYKLPYQVYITNTKNMESLIIEFMSSYNTRTEFWQIKNKSIFLSILYQFFKQLKLMEPARTVLAKDRLVYDVQQYIRQNYRSKLNLDEICFYAGVSKNYANTLFKEKTGKTIIMYLNTYRLDKAIQLLKSSDLKIQLIGEYVGLPDIHYFSRLMKQYTGKSPSEFRH